LATAPEKARPVRLARAAAAALILPRSDSMEAEAMPKTAVKAVATSFIVFNEKLIDWT